MNAFVEGFLREALTKRQPISENDRLGCLI